MHHRRLGFIGIEELGTYAHSKHRVMTQAVAVVAVFVSRGNLVDALFEQVVQAMGDIARMAGVVDGRAYAFGEANLAVYTLKQQRPQVGRHAAAGKVGADGAARYRSKPQLFWRRIHEGKDLLVLTNAFLDNSHCTNHLRCSLPSLCKIQVRA